MRQLHPRHAPERRPATASAIAAAIGLALLLGGCNRATATLNPGMAPSAIASDGSAGRSSPAASADASTSPLPVGQTDSDWGRIWDSLPTAFPVYPGAVPAEQAQTGPVSATLAVAGREARAVVTWMQAELERSAYRTEALNGPLEDGSYVLESIGSPTECRVEVAVAPLGDLTLVTVRYGAACPSP
jgi:hypothetical protein